jgi:hypothetical protein
LLRKADYCIEKRHTHREWGRVELVSWLYCDGNRKVADLPGYYEKIFGLVIALRPQTPKHIRGGWSHYTDTSEPVDGGVL